MAEDNCRGEGDEKIVQAAAALFKLKDEGTIRNVGISGYPLPTLLRLSILIKSKLNRPLDAVMSFSHSNLQNYSLAEYTSLFEDRGGVDHIITASPLNMGLLTEKGPPDWHPSPQGLRETAMRAAKLCRERNTTLMRVAEEFSLRWEEMVHRLTGRSPRGMSTVVVGLSNPKEVHEVVDVYMTLRSDAAKTLHDRDVSDVMELFSREGWSNYNWTEQLLLTGSERVHGIVPCY